MSTGSKWGRLPKAFAFYAEYHSDPINQLIHIICVPMILVTAFVFFTYVPIAEYLPFPLVKTLLTAAPWAFPVGLNAGALVALGYALYYIYLSPTWLGFSAALLALSEFVAGQYWRQAVSGPLAWQSALAVHVFTWIAQFYGHGVHEGRAPALLDNLFQALFLAPLFVYMEVLFGLGLLGDFKREVDPLVAAGIAKWKAQGGGKGKGESAKAK